MEREVRVTFRFIYDDEHEDWSGLEVFEVQEHIENEVATIRGDGFCSEVDEVEFLDGFTLGGPSGNGPHNLG